jgi:asparagine synthase (glutamine-hydrolysing)
MIIVGVAGVLPPAKLVSLTLDLLREQRVYCSDVLPVRSADGIALGAASPGSIEGSIAEDGPCSVVGVVRFDNRAEIERRLGGDRHHQTDVELLAALWRQAGEEALDWMVGDYAFAIHDSRTRSLSLVRDITGQRPLHYAQSRNGFAFASMPAALRHFDGNARLDCTILAKSAMAAADYSDGTCFAGVSRVQPGEILRLEPDGRIRKNSYWTPSCNPPDRGNRRDYVEQYRHLLDVAVGSRIWGSTLPIATHLSGGFDSSSVTATASRLLGCPEKVVAFTCAPQSTASAEQLPEFGDESSLARDVAERYGIRHLIVRETAPIADIIRAQGVLLQRPVGGAFNMAWWVAIREHAAKAGASRILVGQMGNMTLNAGTVTDLSEWLRRRHWLTWAKQSIGAARRPDLNWRGVLYNTLWPWLPRTVSNILERVALGVRPIRTMSFVRSDWQESIAADPPVSTNAYERRLPLLAQLEPSDLRMAAMAGHGVDELDPFSDRRVVEFSLTVPPDQLFWNGVQRPMMREALADRLPPTLFETFGRGQQAADWAARVTKPQLLSMIDEISGSRTAHELLDIDRMRSAIATWPTENWRTLPIIYQYRIALMDAISVGMFAAAYD